VLYGKGVMVNMTCDRPRQNKANLGTPGRDPRVDLQNKANPRRTAPNKPNFGTGRTKANSGWGKEL
jgi:hypothetical protein